MLSLSWHMQIDHSEFQDQLVRGLAHRMNNILTLFHGYLGLLLDNKRLDKATLEGLVKIKEGARAASELMDRTHSLVRPPTVVWREVKLGAFLQMLRPSFDAIRGAKTELVIDCQEDLPTIWADASRIKTAILEIVRNALEATLGGGHVKIILRAAPGPPGNHARQPIQWVSMTVIDDGHGIPGGMAEKIFQPFFTTKKKQNAAGLGLTVALGFIQQAGGVLRHESEPGKTTFQMLLPCRGETA